MSVLLEWLRIALLTGSMFFFITGSLGLLRFPDTFTRLHAVTKADNVGLGLLITALALHSPEWQGIGLLALIWILTMASGATSAQLLARYAREQESSTDDDR